jgi:GT2 family glycosyltransferase
MLPYVSVILPVRNERAMLPRLLEQLLAQNYPADRYEILVVDGHSTDGTADLVRRRFCGSSTASRLAPIRLLKNPKERTAAGRNQGLRSAHGDIILFIDGHCSVPSRNLIEDSVSMLERTGAGCLCRPQPLQAPSATDMGEIIAEARGLWLGRERECAVEETQKAGPADPVCGGATYRREVFERVGLYDESFESGEDVEMNTRVREAGIAAYTDPRLAVLYQPAPRVGVLFQQMVRSGRTRVRLMRRHPGTLSLRRLTPLALLASLPLAMLAWWLTPPVAAVLTLPAACFAAALGVASVQMGARSGSGGFWAAPWIFSAMWLGVAWGEMVELAYPAAPRRGTAMIELLAPRETIQVAARAARAA